MKESNVSILGTEKKSDFKAENHIFESPGKKRQIWIIKELENAFHFVLSSEKREFYLEYDEATAAGDAYKRQGPLTVMDVVDMLEEETPLFHALTLSENALLIRKRIPKSIGLALEIDGEINIFIKDATLQTINFMDFYTDFLKPKIRGSDDQNNDAKNPDISLWLSGVVNS